MWQEVYSGHHRGQEVHRRVEGCMGQRSRGNVEVKGHVELI